jgi:nickel-dependent lactate racemase
LALSGDWPPLDRIIPKKAFPIADLESRLDRELEEPVSSPPLSELLSGAKRVSILVSDVTRSTGVHRILPLLLPRLHGAGIRKNERIVLVALGNHRRMTREEMERVVGGEAMEGFRIVQHDSGDPHGFLDLGVTSRGTPVEFSRLLGASDLLIATGAINYHYFAGYTGGRKVLLPGVASRRAAIANHLLVLGGESGRHPGCRPGRLRGNPVHEDMVEAVAGVERCFLLNTIMDGWEDILDLFGGHLILSHERGTRALDAMYSVEVSEKKPVVVASCGGYPRDINMIQSHKAMEMVRGALEEGGTLVLAAECSKGFGSPDFFPWFRHRDPRVFLERLKADYQIYGQTAYALYAKTRMYRIVLLSSLPPEAVRAMGMIPAANPEEALAIITRRHGRDFEGYLVPEAATTYVTTLMEGGRR